MHLCFNTGIHILILEYTSFIGISLWTFYRFKLIETRMFNFKTALKSILKCSMPGNVVKGNQNYANEILTGASGHELQSVGRMSTNLLSRYLQISKRENRQF